MREIFFFGVIIFIANIIQGITGFAGTILAMPLSLMLVGYATAKPILNILGLVSGIYVFIGNRKYVSWNELKKTILIMGVGIFSGILIRAFFIDQEAMLYIPLGIFLIIISLQGLYVQIKNIKSDGESRYIYILLPVAGIVHGIFVSGGPLLIGYLSKKLKDKRVFRATISTVWIILNGLILFDDIRTGLWDFRQIKIFAFTLPFLLVGMWLGSILYSKMSQKAFMVSTYILLLGCGFLLLNK